MPRTVGFADLNSDGRTDAAVGQIPSGEDIMNVLLQEADGSLGPPTLYSTGDRPRTLAVGDFDNNGRQDVVLGNADDHIISVFFQQADGTMGWRPTYATDDTPDAVATGDLNNNCLDDIAVSHWNASNIRTFIQQPNGTLQSTSYPSPEAGRDDIDTGDVNHDGLTDIVKMNGQGINPDLSVYLQTTDGTFDGPFSYSLAGNYSGDGVAVGDVTGDGLNDVVMAYGGNSPYSKLAVFAQTPDGVLSLAATYDAYDIPEPVEIADVNLDGRLDVVVAHGGWFEIGVFLQQADGTLAPYELYPVPYASHYYPQALDVGDINHDGAPDVGLADYNNGLIVLYNHMPAFTMELALRRFIEMPGDILTGTLTLNPGNGFSGPVTLSIEGLPPGSSYVFASNPVIPAAQTTFTITTDTFAESDAIPLTFKGSGNGVINTATTCLRVDPYAISGLTATNDSPTVFGHTTTLTGSVEFGHDVVYTWDFGDGTTGSGQVVTHTYPAIPIGNYRVVLTAHNTVTTQTTQTYVTIVEEPIAGLTAVNDSPTPLGQATNFTATVSAGTNITYTWDFGDGNYVDGPIVSHIYPEVGIYTATVLAINTVGGQYTQTYVTVVDAAIEGLTVVNDSPTGFGQATNFTATVSAGSNVSYTWNFGDGTVGSGPFVSHIYPTMGIYTATVTATNSANSQSVQTVVAIVDAGITGLTAVNDSPTRLGNTTTFTATITAGTNVSYTWNFGDGTLGYGDIVSHIYPAVGIYTAVVTASNIVNSSTTTMFAQVLDPITGLIAGNDSPTPLGSLTWFSATVSAGTDVEYSWDFGDGTAGSGIVVTHVYPAVGTYTAVVTATNPVSTLTTTTTVEIIDEGITELMADNSSPTIIGQSTSLSATVSAGTNISYTWNFGDGSLSYGDTPTHIYPATGIYTAVVTATNSVSTLTTTTIIEVVDEAIIGLTAVNDSPTLLGNGTVLSASVVMGSNIVYIWDLGDGTILSGATITHTYSLTGTYTYTAIVTASNSTNEMSVTTAVVVYEPEQPISYRLFLPTIQSPVAIGSQVTQITGYTPE
ncbi:MAG: PKD domain-containing protein [Anaerolineae bacterium]|nr:PKD domain-containing protein [Anaerolineae bacterium]